MADTLLRVALAVAVAAAIFWIGLKVLTMLARSQPEPPPAGELRKVKLTYRCSICGTEVRMTTATDENPAPPRHCLEDMDLVAPID